VITSLRELLIDGLNKITRYVNGGAKTAVTSDIPIIALTPTLVCHSVDTTDLIMSVHWADEQIST